MLLGRLMVQGAFARREMRHGDPSHQMACHLSLYLHHGWGQSPLDRKHHARGPLAHLL